MGESRVNMRNGKPAKYKVCKPKEVKYVTFYTMVKHPLKSMFIRG